MFPVVHRISSDIRLKLIRQVWRKSVFQFSYCNMATNFNSTEIEIPVPYGHIAGKVWNSGHEPILALHGWMDNAGTWDRLAPLLPKNYSIIAIDFPNHGLSSPYPLAQGGYFTENLIVIERIARHFGWEKFNILGHSMGGGSGMMYAATFPEKIRKLIMIDSMMPLGVNPDNQPQKTAQGITGLLEAEHTITLAEPPPRFTYVAIKEKLLNSYGNMINETAAGILLKRGTKRHGDGTFSFCYDPRLKVRNVLSLSPDQIKSFLQRLKCELLILKASETLADEFKNQKQIFLEVIDKIATDVYMFEIQGTHHMHLNDPESVLSHVTEFLTSQTGTKPFEGKKSRL